ncbi:TPA: DUF551 domain-containing protein [Klebsiella pneumoniae]
MTKSTITREQLLEIIETDHVQCGEASYLARMALAAMDSESGCLPLDYLQGHKDGLEWAAQLAEANHPETGDWLYDDPIELAKAIRKGPDMPVADSEPVGTLSVRVMSYNGKKIGTQFGFVHSDAAMTIAEGDYPLYRHAQQPVVPDEKDKAVDADDHPLLWSFNEGWNACRAAMLQAGTLNNEGTKQAWTGIPDIDNAINMLDRIDTLDSCDDDRIEAVKTVLRRLAGNSPVIPDGYVMVPKEMTDEIGEAIAMQANCCGGIALDIYDAMIAAAPHDTPALNSVQSVVHVSDGWIPVSERMPEVGDIVLTAMGGVVNVGEMECSAANCRFFTSVISGRELPATHWMPLPAAPQEVK